ncbi:MAG: TonB C-terminal domain-containing protein [Deltaproteobacteria bacterium]|nr:TonB C-terminal domain-containing protein [Deltaproteobacteria bacterium]
MSLALVMNHSNQPVEMKWTPMVSLSVLFHLAAFALILFVPGTGSSIRSLRGTVYEVNLVEMPGGGAARIPGPALQAEAKAKKVIPRETRARRIEEVKREEKPLVVAKKTVEKVTPKTETPKVSPNELLDKAISKIARKVKSENQDHLNTAISRLQAKVGGGPGQGPGGGGIGAGQGMSGGPMALYQMEVEARIRSNWSYPVAMDKKDLEAVVVLLVRQDGTILKSRIERRSLSALFDESVIKAVERSNPLPPFPDTYRMSQDELEITFNLKDLEGQ